MWLYIAKIDRLINLNNIKEICKEGDLDIHLNCLKDKPYILSYDTVVERDNNWQKLIDYLGSIIMLKSLL
jgi:hypothetical protein